MDDAFKYVETTGGLCSESAYPYQMKNGHCKASTCGTLYDSIGSYVDVSADDEKALQAAISQQGPVSIAMYANISVM